MHGYLFKTLRNRAVYFGRQLWVTLELHNSYGYCTLSLKRKLAGKHFVKHNTYRINISLFVGLFSPCLLGADVMNRAYSLIGYGALVATCKTGDTEVGNLNCTVRQNHDILRLNVTVNDTLIVSVL